MLYVHRVVGFVAINEVNIMGMEREEKYSICNAHTRICSRHPHRASHAVASIARV